MTGHDDVHGPADPSTGAAPAGVPPSRFYRRLQELFGDYPATTITSSLFLFVLLYGLWQLSSRIGGDPATAPPVASNQLLIILGILCGWIAGLFASPFSDIEKGEFAELRKAIYAFLTGYLVSKVDRFLEKALFTGDSLPVSRAWEQVALFGGAFVASALITFIWRRYGFRKEHKALPPRQRAMHALTLRLLRAGAAARIRR